MAKYDRALGSEHLAEQNSTRAIDEPLERLPPRLQWPQALIVSLEAHKIEGHERDLRAAALGQEGAEVAAPVLPQHDRLAVDQRPVHIEGADRLDDHREPIGEVRTAPRPERARPASSEDAEAVVIDFVQPAGTGANGRGCS
ncbi:MAG TPA: hypothetical protein VGG77_05570 [Roseiarcus sp.]